MNWQDKRVKVIAALVAIILFIIGFRIITNVISARERASQVTQGRVVAVPVDTVIKKTIEPKLTFAGNLEPFWQADLGPKVAGRISKIAVSEGAYVNTGTLLAVLDGSELSGTADALRGNVYDAKAALEQAETSLARTERLYQAGAQSKQELDNAVFVRDMARGKLDNAEGSYNSAVAKMDGTNLLAPHDGFVVKRLKQEGYYANAGETVFQLADIGVLLVKINIPEGQIGSVSLGASAEITIPALNNKVVVGKITKIAQVADLPTRTFAAEISVENADYALKGSMYANVQITLPMKNDVLVVPTSAIVMREDQRTVYIVGSDNVVSRKVLTTGFIGDGLVEVLDGLAEGDKIVTGGQNKLREGSKIRNDEDSQK